MDKTERIRKWLAETGRDGVVLTRRDNFTWASGAKNNVVGNTETGVASLVIEKDRVDLFADSSDLPRMEAEQNPLQAAVHLVPWYRSYDDAVRKFLSSGRFASDTGIAGTENAEEELVSLRMVLTPEEVIKYRELGKLCAAAVEAAVREAMPGETEEEIAVNLKKKCIGCGISPDCVLVGADERILQYRHPVPSRNRLKKMLMVVLGGEKYGLNISMTRFAAFGSVSPETEETFQKNARIFAFMQTGMQDGMPYAEYFEKLKQAYTDEGYPGGWKGHHQGGPTGYACREFVIKPDTAGSIRKNQAYAWNPTLPGSKFEETTFLTDQGTECFTDSGNWPRYTAASSCGSFSVADILRR